MLRSFSSLPRATLQRASMMASPRVHAVTPKVSHQMIANIQRAISTSTIRTQAAAATAEADHTNDHNEKSHNKKHSSPAKHDNEKSSDSESQPSTIGDYVKQYGGWYPLIGLGGFIAISKELLVLNEEFLMVSNFAAFIFLSWLAVGDTVHQMVKDQATAIAKQHDDASDLYITSIEAVIKAYENQQAIVPLLQSLKSEYSTLNEQVTKAKEMRGKQAAHDAALSRLNAIYQREQAEKAKALAEVYSNAFNKVRADLEKLDDKERNSIIDFAIDVVEGKRETIDDQHDPVKRLYNKYLSSTQSSTGSQSATQQKQKQRA